MGSWLVHSPGMLNDLEFPPTPSLMLRSPRQEMGCPPPQSSLDPFKPTGGGRSGQCREAVGTSIPLAAERARSPFQGSERDERQQLLVTVTAFQESCGRPPPLTWVPKQESPPEGTRWQPGFLSLLLVCLHSRSTVSADTLSDFASFPTLTVSVGKEWKKHQITVGFEVSQW